MTKLNSHFQRNNGLEHRTSKGILNGSYFNSFDHIRPLTDKNPFKFLETIEIERKLTCSRKNRRTSTGNATLILPT